ncbi:MAG: hypothetical protein K5764_02100 [Prevotella sp.]|nr:hypothetical protein [Prevotella sp.]
MEDRCAREAKAYNQQNCPMKMEENIILDSLTFERSTHTLHYYYRLTGAADVEGALDKKEAVGLLKEGLKNTTSMRAYKDAKYNFAYTYFSEKEPQKVWLEVVLTAKDYEQEVKKE